MSYEKQNFTDGQVLTAAQLNHIENGIVDLEERVNQGGGGGGDNALHVVIETNDNGERVVNYTAEEIYNRLQDEGNACHVYLDWGGYLYQLARISQNEAVFEECIFYEEEEDTPRCFRLTRYYLGNDYQLHLYEQRIDLNGGGGDLGDIETALDSIIAIQNQLIGGDGV